MKTPSTEAIEARAGTPVSFTRYVFPRANASSQPPGEETGAQTPDWGDVVREVEAEERERRAWERGVEEGRNKARAEFEETIGREREAINRLLAGAEADRKSYFQQAEVEVVHLALAIAGKILAREVRLDALMLRGAVRVALEKVAAATEIRLRVHPESAAAWSEHLKSQADLAVRPEVQADPSLDPGRCVLETSLGATDLGWETQLKELEQSFLDLMALRPDVR